jgi:hypothetical protein
MADAILGIKILPQFLSLLYLWAGIAKLLVVD